MTEPRISDDADLDVTFDHMGDEDSSFVDGLAEEFAERCRRGESPSVDEYLSRYPEHASALRHVLPSVAMMERFKGHVRASSGVAEESTEPPPERLGEYRIVRELGRGGMGIVYEAFQESLGRHVALKVIPRHGLLDPKRRRRFQREAMAVAQLHHTNIVPIFAAGEHDGLPYYAMQYIRGKGLDRLLEGWRRDGLERGPDHWRFVARVGMQAAEALQYAHDQGILHRDIKPANVLIDEHLVAWITDFGLAKILGRDELTHSGDVVGTLRYLAPEALSGQTDSRGDIYSLGLTLYELLTLKLPFGDLSPSELLRCVTEEAPTRPRKLDRTIPLDLETIILKATAREPGHRYRTAGEMAEDLRAFLDDRPIRARRASAPERLARWCRRNKVLAGVSAIAAASVLFALGAVSWAYMAQTRALEKEVANVRYSLNAIEQFFNEFNDPWWDAGPFGVGGPGGGPGRSRPPRDEPGGPPRGPDMGPPGPPPRDRGEKRGPARPGPGMFAAKSLSDRELALLEDVLSFYDGFAKRNETNSQLEGEAAKAHRKVAAVYRFLGRDEEAEEAHAKALERFESLVRRHGKDSDYAFELARTLALDGPGASTALSEEDEPGLRRAIAIVEGMTKRATGDERRIPYEAALARWMDRLAKRLEKVGRVEEAVASFRAAIEHDEWLVDHIEKRWSEGVRFMLVWRRAALAEALIQAGRKDEARAIVERAADDLIRKAGEDGRGLGPDDRIAEGLESLAGTCREVGAEGHATRLQALAQSILERPREGRFGRRGGGGTPKKSQRGAGRDRPEGPPPGDFPPRD